MTELETLERAKMYMEKLANGIDPITEAVIPEGEVVNNVRLSRCFFYVADVLRQVIERGGVNPPPAVKKQAFAVPMEKRSAFAFSKEPINATEIVRRLNDLAAENMVKLTTTIITEWLLDIELLQVETDREGKSVKRPTPRANALGITVEERNSMNGPYTVVTYDRQAQQFVLDNLDAALELRRQKTENQGAPWSVEDDQCLRQLHAQNVPVPQIALTLKRNSSSIRSRMRKLGLPY